jgi:6-phosphogluconolactonase
MPITIHQHDGTKLPRSVCEYVGPLARDAIAARGLFTIALSGGSMPKVLGAAGGLSSLNTDWSKWFVFFSDERCVELTHDDSNYKACTEHFFAKVAIPASQIFKIDPSLPPLQAAAAYNTHLVRLWGKKMPSFDLMMLGMGQDGHTASLFPGRPLVGENQLFVASITDSPKPPSSRITLTLPVLNNSKQVCFIATGESKAPLLPEILALRTLGSSQSQLPAALVRPTSGNLHWFIDGTAASELQLPSSSSGVHTRTRLAVVTGANKGIGYHCAEQLRQRLPADYEVLLTSRNKKLGLEAQASLLRSGVRVGYRQLDIADSTSVGSFATFVRAEYGRLDM